MDAELFTQVKADLRRDEGTGPRGRGTFLPYRDTVGKLTIGYGRNLDDVGIDESEANLLLDHDVLRVEEGVIQAFPRYLRLDRARQAVLLNMAFNLGVRGLMGFRRMLTALSQQDYEGAAREMLDSKWVVQVGARARRLSRQMATGQWESASVPPGGGQENT